MPAQALVWTLIGFFSGSLMFSYWIGRAALHRDIRDVGDGNPGMTNVLRSGGKGLAALAFVLDVLKAAIPVSIAYWAVGIQDVWLIPVALAPVVGHAYSPWLHFRGGKAVAASFGMWIALTIFVIPADWRADAGAGIRARHIVRLGDGLHAGGADRLRRILVQRPAVHDHPYPEYGAATVEIPRRFARAAGAAPLAHQTPMAELVIIFSAAALCVIAALAILNTLTFPRLRPDTDTAPAQRVSVLIPARNEAAVIGDTVRALLNQSHLNLELIVLDDGSTDGTAEIARAAAEGDDARLRILTGQPLPDGWFGKNWACAQLAEAAASDVLLFTDADVQWSAEGVAAALALLERSGAGLLSVWPTQKTVTWGERLVVPLMAFVILGYLPWPLVGRTRFAVFAAANGQCLLFRRRGL